VAKTRTMTLKKTNDSLQQSANYIAHSTAKRIEHEAKEAREIKPRLITLPKRPAIPKNRSERRAMHKKPKGAW